MNSFISRTRKAISWAQCNMILASSIERGRGRIRRSLVGCDLPNRCPGRCASASLGPTRLCQLRHHARRHRRGQVWLIPATRAIWLPAGLRHSIAISGEVAMRTLYIAGHRATPLPSVPAVLEVVPLLRETHPPHYSDRDAGARYAPSMIASRDCSSIFSSKRGRRISACHYPPIARARRLAGAGLRRPG